MASGAFVTVTWTVNEGAETAFIKKLKGDFLRVVSRPGFRNIRLLRDDSEKTKFILVEEWDSAQAFKDYAEYRNHDEGAKVFLEMASAPPQIAIYDLSPLAAATV